jgi:membrane-associated protease RseP (regulator of RpoE activity)
MKRITVNKLLALGLATAGWINVLPTTAGEGESGNKAGYLGVAVRPVEGALRQHLNLAGGLIVDDVMKESPADDAGIRQHDILVKLDDQKLFNSEQLQSLVRSLKPGLEIDISILREGGKKKLKAEVGGTDARARGATRFFGDLETSQGQIFRIHPNGKDNKIVGEGFTILGKPKDQAFLGVEVKELGNDLREQIEIDGEGGVVVGHVTKGSAAERSGIREHDVIVELDGALIQGTAGFVGSIQEREVGDEIELDIIRDGEAQEIEVALGNRGLTMEWTGSQRRPFDGEQKKDGNVFHLELKPGGDGGIHRFERILKGNNSEEGVKTTREHIIRRETPVIIDGRVDSIDIRGKTMYIKSPKTNVSVVELDGVRKLIAKDKDSKIIFEGKVGEGEEFEGLPPHVKELLERTETVKDFHLKADPLVEEREIRIVKPKNGQNFILFESKESPSSPERKI